MFPRVRCCSVPVWHLCRIPDQLEVVWGAGEGAPGEREEGPADAVCLAVLSWVQSERGFGGRSTVPQKGSFKHFTFTILCAQMCGFMNFKSLFFEVHPPVSRPQGVEGQERHCGHSGGRKSGGAVCVCMQTCAHRWLSPQSPTGSPIPVLQSGV